MTVLQWLQEAGMRIASSANDAIAPAAMHTNNLFVILGNFERDSISIANMITTDGVITTSLNDA